MNKAFNRHNDICKKNTLIGANEELILTDKSSLSELNIGIETLMECNQAGMYTIQDFSKANLVTLTLDTIHELTGAIIIYNAARD